ncbi:MAG: caspase family protein [Xanthobacteraceae bacterium]|nr:caspase family protein [Xanthobacteraceae bacterium]
MLLRCLLLLVAVAAGLAVPGGAARAERRLALVIGNDLYVNMPASRQLRKAANDARTIGAALSSLGFEVVLGTNLGRQGIIDKLAQVTAKIAPGDTVAFFYAGHGVAIGGVNYLVPSDVPAVSEGAEARIRGASIAEPDLIAEIQAKSPRVALLVIDACRDNPFPRAAGRSIGNARGLADARPARGIFMIYSAGIGQSALDRLNNSDPSPNSVFTRIFAREIVKPGLHLGDVAVETRERVAALALTATDTFGQPSPHEQTPAYYDQTLGGRIFLAGAGSAVPAAASPAENSTKTVVANVGPNDGSSKNAGSKNAGSGVAPNLLRAARPPRPGSPHERCARNGGENYCVSSVLSSQFGNSYGPEHLFEAGHDTAWVEGRAGEGVGEWVTVEFDGLRRIDAIRLRNGYQKNRDIFRKNGRVRRLRVEFSQGETRTFTLADRLGAETLHLGRPVDAYWVKFVVDEVWPGSKYTDTAISRLVVNAEPVR